MDGMHRFRLSFHAAIGAIRTRLDCSGPWIASQAPSTVFIDCKLSSDYGRAPALPAPPAGDVNMKLVAKSNVIKNGRAFVQHVVPAVIKPARTLWHEVIGFLFLSIAVIFLFSGIRYVREFDGSPGSIIRIIMVGFCVCLMGGYGISSFLRARRISRS